MMNQTTIIDLRMEALVATAAAVTLVLTAPWWIAVGAVVCVGLLSYGVWRAASSGDSPARRSADDPLARALIRGMGAIFIYLDEDDRVVLWNEQASTVFGLCEQAVLGHPLSALPLCWEEDALTPALTQVRRLNRELRLPDLILKRPDNEEVLVGLTLHPVHDTRGRRSGLIVLGSDITERRRMEAELQLKQAQLAHAGRLACLGELAAGLAHELSQPLSAARMGCDQLLRRAQGDPALSGLMLELLDTVSAQVQRASEIVAHVTAFSRRAAGGAAATVRKVPTDINATLRRAYRMVRHQLESAGIETALDLDDALPHALADAARLEQVLVNLLINARDALQEQAARPGPQGDRPRRIIMRSYQRAGRCCIDVIDNGPGIDADALPHVFEAFYTTKEQGKGTGLGLSISAGIVRELGGELTVDSTPGQGAAFTVALLAHNTDARHTAVAVQPPREETSCIRC